MEHRAQADIERLSSHQLPCQFTAASATVPAPPPQPPRSISLDRCRHGLASPAATSAPPPLCAPPVRLHQLLGVAIVQRLQQPGSHARPGAAGNGVAEGEALQAVAVPQLAVCVSVEYEAGSRLRIKSRQQQRDPSASRTGQRHHVLPRLLPTSQAPCPAALPAILPGSPNATFPASASPTALPATNPPLPSPLTSRPAHQSCPVCPPAPPPPGCTRWPSCCLRRRRGLTGRCFPG